MVTPNIKIREVVPNQNNVVVSINTGNDKIDNADNRATSIPTADANVTLTETQQLTNGFLDFTGGMSANRDVYVVPLLNRSFSVRNNTTGGFNLIFQYLAGGTTVSLGPGLSAILQCDGTDVVLVGKDSAGGSASGVTFTPSATISSTNVQDAIAELSSSQTNDLDITITGNRILTVDEFTDNVYINLSGTPSADFTFDTPAVQPLTFDGGLVNGDFETGNTTPWSYVSGSGAFTAETNANSRTPFQGTYFAQMRAASGAQEARLIIDLSALPNFSGANVDSGLVNIDFDGRKNDPGFVGACRFRIEARTSVDGLISTIYDINTDPNDNWDLISSNAVLPSTCRKLWFRLTTTGGLPNGGNLDALTLTLDDFGGGGLSNKGFLIINNGTSKTATMSVDQGAGSSVVIPEGQTRLIYSDGDNIIDLSADPIHTSIQTTDATADQVVVAVPIPSGQTITLNGILQAREPATGDDLHVEIFAGGKNVAGTSTLTGKMFKDNTSGGAAAWDFDVDVDDTGDTIRVLFTGEAAHTIDVTLDYTVSLRG